MRLLYDLGKEEYFGSDTAQETLKKIGEEEWRKFQERAGSKMTAIQRLSEVGLTVDQYKELLVQNLVAGEYLREKVSARVSVSPTEIRAYYEDHREDFKVPQTVVYRQVLLTVVDKADEPAQKQKADEALRRIKAGEDFAKVADSCSEERDKWPGGLHEVQVPEGQADWLPPAVQGLAIGQLSEVRRAGGWFCISRLEEVKPPRAAPFEEVQGTIKAKLLGRKYAAARAEYLDEIKGKAHIEYCPAAAQLGLP
jgi:parvulin-like peptidyl-prolyl isomerase